MTSLTNSPSIDQAAKLVFEDNFYRLAQQSESQLVASKAIKWLPSNGKTLEMARIGRLELNEVNSRNPDKQYGDYAVDNRRFTKRRFTKTILLDAKFDINELITDPSSDVLFQLNAAKERTIDRIGVAAALGSVLVGAPDAAAATLTAAQDGVLTVDATAGLTYAKIQEITQNFINNDLQYDDFQGSMFCITGKENSQLMASDQFINSFYISGKPVDDGIMNKTGTYYTKMFAGSVNGGVTALNPILPEVSTTRNCVVLTPGSIAMSMELASMEVTKSAIKVNSWDVTIDFWINAMRTEGARVIQVNTTI